LAGSSADYPVGNLEIHAGGKEGWHLSNGVRGAFALQPHFMMDKVQWWSYAEATRGLPLYVPFGTWRTAIGKAKKTRSATLANRRKAYNQVRGLGIANANRRQTAKADLESLVEVARPLLKRALAECSGKRGRPAHRARLKDLLAQEGYSVSDHQLKKLMSMLSSRI